MLPDEQRCTFSGCPNAVTHEAFPERANGDQVWAVCCEEHSKLFHPKRVFVLDEAARAEFERQIGWRRQCS